MKIKIFIQSCNSCHSHQWCTHHSQQKYKSMFNKISSQLHQAFREQVQVLKPDESQLKFLIQQRTRFFGRQFAIQADSIGAFEIYLQDFLIFSKILNNRWPSLQQIQDLTLLALQHLHAQGTLLDFKSIVAAQMKKSSQKVCQNRKQSFQEKERESARQNSLQIPSQQEDNKKSKQQNSQSSQNIRVIEQRLGSSYANKFANLEQSSKKFIMDYIHKHPKKEKHQLNQAFRTLKRRNLDQQVKSNDRPIRKTKLNKYLIAADHDKFNQRPFMFQREQTLINKSAKSFQQLEEINQRKFFISPPTQAQNNLSKKGLKPKTIAFSNKVGFPEYQGPMSDKSETKSEYRDIIKRKKNKAGDFQSKEDSVNKQISKAGCQQSSSTSNIRSLKNKFTSKTNQTQINNWNHNPLKDISISSSHLIQSEVQQSHSKRFLFGKRNKNAEIIEESDIHKTFTMFNLQKQLKKTQGQGTLRSILGIQEQTQIDPKKSILNQEPVQDKPPNSNLICQIHKQLGDKECQVDVKQFKQSGIQSFQHINEHQKTFYPAPRIPIDELSHKLRWLQQNQQFRNGEPFYCVLYCNGALSQQDRPLSPISPGTSQPLNVQKKKQLQIQREIVEIEKENSIEKQLVEIRTFCDGTAQTQTLDQVEGGVQVNAQLCQVSSQALAALPEIDYKACLNPLQTVSSANPFLQIKRQSDQQEPDRSIALQEGRQLTEELKEQPADPVAPAQPAKITQRFVNINQPQSAGEGQGQIQVFPLNKKELLLQIQEQSRILSLALKAAFQIGINSVSNLFQNQGRTHDGVMKVWWFETNRWVLKQIKADDWLKALRELSCALNQEQILQGITGAPFKSLQVQSKYQRIWKLIETSGLNVQCKAFEKFMCLPKHKYFKFMGRGEIQANQVYQLLESKSISYEGKNQRLVKLGRRTEGQFWMRFQDFKQQFYKVVLLSTHPQAWHSQVQMPVLSNPSLNVFYFYLLFKEPAQAVISLPASQGKLKPTVNIYQQTSPSQFQYSCKAKAQFFSKAYQQGRYLFIIEGYKLALGVKKQSTLVITIQSTSRVRPRKGRWLQSKKEGFEDLKQLFLPFNKKNSPIKRGQLLSSIKSDISGWELRSDLRNKQSSKKSNLRHQLRLRAC